MFSSKEEYCFKKAISLLLRALCCLSEMYHPSAVLEHGRAYPIRATRFLNSGFLLVEVVVGAIVCSPQSFKFVGCERLFRSTEGYLQRRRKNPSFQLTFPRTRLHSISYDTTDIPVTWTSGRTWKPGQLALQARQSCPGRWLGCSQSRPPIKKPLQYFPHFLKKLCLERSFIL